MRVIFGVVDAELQEVPDDLVMLGKSPLPRVKWDPRSRAQNCYIPVESLDEGRQWNDICRACLVHSSR